MFNCKQCGSCCQSIGGNEIYRNLDNGNGICINYDAETKLCKIYPERPLLCRIDDAYFAFFAEEFSQEEYFEMNYKACAALRECLAKD
ncbi:MAG: YkgJ family cysteine cluster protein [Defluviitaleaceae bacterium]|nr:YkgJ family cysteine cluster protein [Defluviitaleaceae bacterium]